MKSQNGMIYDDSICLAELNDSGASFKEIAKLIKSNFKEV